MLERLTATVATALQDATRPHRPGRWSSFKLAAPTALRPLLAIEWLTEWVVYGLKRWAMVDLLQALASFSVLVAAFSYINGRDDTRKEKQYQAWQVINAAQGKPGNGGRIDALEDLHRDGVSLEGVDLSRARLEGIQLPKAALRGAILDSTWFYGADLSGSDLTVARIQRANFGSAKMIGTSLQASDIRGAGFNWAKMDGAVLSHVNAVGTSFFSADLSGAFLVGGNFDQVYFNATKLTGANLMGARFQNSNFWCHVSRADLSYTDLRGADLINLTGWKEVKSLTLANIHGVKNAPDGFVRWALDSMSAVSIPFDYDWEARKRAWSDSVLGSKGL